MKYSRRLYESISEEGLVVRTYLLDEMLDITRVGKFSQNMAEMIVNKVCESPYRCSAKDTSETTGQSISHTGVWNIIQNMGKDLGEEEEFLLKTHKSGRRNRLI